MAIQRETMKSDRVDYLFLLDLARNRLENVSTILDSLTEEAPMETGKDYPPGLAGTIHNVCGLVREVEMSARALRAIMVGDVVPIKSDVIQ